MTLVSHSRSLSRLSGANHYSLSSCAVKETKLQLKTVVDIFAELLLSSPAGIVL